MGAAINFENLIVVVEIGTIISRKSNQRVGMFVKVACKLILFKLCNNLHFWKTINQSFSLVSVDFVQNLKVTLGRGECNRVDVIEIPFEYYTGFFKTVD